MTAPEFKHTMKVIVSPGGRMIPAIRASERRTGGNDCIGWRSPQASDGEGGVMEIRPDCAGKYKLRDEAELVGWPTPEAEEARRGFQNRNNGKRGTQKSLTTVAVESLVACATPRAEDAESAGMRHSRGVADTLSAQAGQDASRSNAATGRPAGFRLNPRFSLWLMGYPAAWASCGERAMQSFQKSLRRS